jgi:hypothetical protein
MESAFLLINNSMCAEGVEKFLMPEKNSEPQKLIDGVLFSNAFSLKPGDYQLMISD